MLTAKRLRDKQNYNTLRREVIEAYGGKCVCCNESTFEFLQLDHTNGTGVAAKDRYKKAKTSTGAQLYLWLRRNCYPGGFQVLCANCNYVKRFGKICPHKEFDLRHGIRFVA